MQPDALYYDFLFVLAIVLLLLGILRAAELLRDLVEYFTRREGEYYCPSCSVNPDSDYADPVSCDRCEPGRCRCSEVRYAASNGEPPTGQP